MLPMLRSVAPSLLTWLALIMLMIVVVEATGPVPGLRWDRLQVWEGSAAHDAWSRVDEYVADSGTLWSLDPVESGSAVPPSLWQCGEGWWCVRFVYMHMYICMVLEVIPDISGIKSYSRSMSSWCSPVILAGNAQ